MIKPTVLSSSISVTITLQYWNFDSELLLMNKMNRMGFTINQSNPSIIFKDHTTYFIVDGINRRITFQITNNLTTPDKNLDEILNILKDIGYPYEDTVDRIDINGNVIIKSGDVFTSEVISKNFKPQLSEKIGTILGERIRISGIRILSNEYNLEDSSKSPFAILIEPLITDKSNTKFFIQTMYATDNGKAAINFLKSLYDVVNNILIELDNEQHDQTKESI